MSESESLLNPNAESFKPCLKYSNEREVQSNLALDPYEKLIAKKLKILKIKVDLDSVNCERILDISLRPEKKIPVSICKPPSKAFNVNLMKNYSDLLEAPEKFSTYFERATRPYEEPMLEMLNLRKNDSKIKKEFWKKLTSLDFERTPDIDQFQDMLNESFRSKSLKKLDLERKPNIDQFQDINEPLVSKTLTSNLTKNDSKLKIKSSKKLDFELKLDIDQFQDPINEIGMSSALTPSLKENDSKLKSKRQKFESIDVCWQIPKMSFLIFAFWGLYRHEQAQRPLLSLTYRPDAVKNEIWAVQQSDHKLWNQSCVSSVCKCPPMFGYSVPPNFFGDILPLNYTCPIQTIHLNHYAESTDGNEYILTNNLQHGGLVDELPFEDMIIKNTAEVGVDTLKNQFQTIISEICNLLAKLEEPDSGIEDNEVENEEDCKVDYYTSLWDDDPSNVSYVPFSEQDRDSLVDDNDHPLLDCSKVCLDEEVSVEVNEMIRRSLSPKKETRDINADLFDFGQKEVCDPPCSIWCDSVSKIDAVEETMKIDSKSEQGPSSFVYPSIDLISFEQLDSKEPIPVNITLKPHLDICYIETKERQRSTSLNIWSPSHNETKSDNEVTIEASNMSASRDSLAFSDNVAKLKPSKRNYTLSDSDSGIFSFSSSEEDIYMESFDKNSTWHLVNSEDSLWKPLPESTDSNFKRPFSHKRALDFRQKPCKSNSWENVKRHTFA